MEETHVVIAVLGLGKGKRKVELAQKWLKPWEKHGLKVIVFDPHWHDGKSYESILKELLALIDSYQRNGKVSLVGISAGASLVMNAYLARRKNIFRLVSVVGRLRVGHETWWPRAFKYRATASKAFSKSVTNFELVQKTLLKEDQAKILTVSAFFDELVPHSTSNLPLVNDVTLPMVFHGLAIMYALSQKKPVLEFLVKK